jgi:hypothetical protein
LLESGENGLALPMKGVMFVLTNWGCKQIFSEIRCSGDGCCQPLVPKELSSITRITTGNSSILSRLGIQRCNMCTTTSQVRCHAVELLFASCDTHCTFSESRCLGMSRGIGCRVSPSPRRGLPKMSVIFHQQQRLPNNRAAAAPRCLRGCGQQLHERRTCT